MRIVYHGQLLGSNETYDTFISLLYYYYDKIYS